MILDDLRDEYTTFSSSEDDLLQPLPALPADDIEQHIVSVIQTRNKKLTEKLDSMAIIVQDISNMLQQHVKEQDKVFLDHISTQVNALQDLVDDQECLRDQVARFTEATSSSFAEIFKLT